MLIAALLALICVKAYIGARVAQAHICDTIIIRRN